MAYILISSKVETVFFFFQLPLVNYPAEKDNICFKIQGIHNPSNQSIIFCAKQGFTYENFGTWQDLPESLESNLSFAFLEWLLLL